MIETEAERRVREEVRKLLEDLEAGLEPRNPALAWVVREELLRGDAER